MNVESLSQISYLHLNVDSVLSFLYVIATNKELDTLLYKRCVIIVMRICYYLDECIGVSVY